MNRRKSLLMIIGVVIIIGISLFSKGIDKQVYGVDLSSSEVEYEVYEETVVVSGRWGSGAGEFGIAYAYVSKVEDLIEPISPPQDPVYPKSLAVDSKGNIYILDLVNNRIQKFSSEGKYLFEIPVESFVGAEVVKNEYTEFVEYKVKGSVKVLGINIVIDSKDNLYYYCIKGDKGEVWMFKDDKLVKRWKVPVVNRETGLNISEDTKELYVYDEEKGLIYYIMKKMYESKEEADKRRKNYEGKRMGIIEKDNHIFKVKKRGRDKIEIEIIKPNKEVIPIIIYPLSMDGEVTLFRHLVKEGNLYEVHIGFFPRKYSGEVIRENRIYDFNGQLLKIIKEPKPEITMEREEDGIKVVKWVKRSKNEK